MECRRINTTVVCMDYCSGDTLKRNQYVNIINCRLPGKEEMVSNVHKLIINNRAYYSVITDSNVILWYNIENSASFIRSYSVSVTDKNTNIFQFLSTDKDANYLSRSDETVGNTDSSCSVHRLNSKSIVLFNETYAIVEVPGRILFYDINGSYLFCIEMGIDRASSMYCSMCRKYLFIALEKGMICLYDIGSRSFTYRRRHPVGLSVIFGNIFPYLRYFTIVKSSLLIGRVSDGKTLLELTYPEDITCAATDILHRRVVVGSASGKIFYSRMDNEQAEFTEAKVSGNEIKSVSFSISGRFIFGVSSGMVSVVDSKSGKVVKNLLANSERHLFVYTSSSNLHLQ